MTANIILTHGHHDTAADGQCARELLHYMVTGTHADQNPECLTACCSVLPRLNDSLSWRDDAHRTEVLMPYVYQLLACPRDAEADRRRAYRLADLAVRVIAAEALDSDALRDLDPVVDAKSAKAAAAAAYADADAAADAAYAAARAAAYAAYADADAAADAARAAAYAAYAAYADARAAATIERYSRLILEAICAYHKPRLSDVTSP